MSKKVSQVQVQIPNDWLPLMEWTKYHYPKQKEAVKSFAENWETLFIGGNGTGKTTLLYCIADLPQEIPFQSFIQMDPPKHDVHRAAVQPVVAPVNLAKLEPIIRERVGKILDELPVGEAFDWVERVSIVLTSQMLATLFDFPFEERRKLTYWSDATTGAPDISGGDFITPEDRNVALADCGEHLVRLWHQGHWYYPLHLMLFSAFVCVAASRVAATSGWAQRCAQGPASVRLALRGGALGLALLCANYYAQTRAAEPLPSAQRFWDERASALAGIERICGGCGGISFDDGILAYGLGKGSGSNGATSGDGKGDEDSATSPAAMKAGGQARQRTTGPDEPKPASRNGHPGDKATAIDYAALERAGAAMQVDENGGPQLGRNDQFARFQRDAPTCDNCGAITVRNGNCYLCHNCGNSMGCS